MLRPSRLLSFSCCLAVLLLLLGCKASLSQEQAEQVAISFMDSRIKFFVKDNQTGQQVVQNYTIESIETTPSGDDWFVYFHIVKEQKKNDLVMKIDSRQRKVVELNGQKVE